MNILPDTNIWCHHLRKSDKTLQSIIEHDFLTMHPLIVGELAMADYVHRKPLLENLLEMPMLRGATFQETLHFVSERKIDSLGIQWNDAILLASVIIAGNTLLWTRDRRLREIATQFGVAYSAE